MAIVEAGAYVAPRGRTVRIDAAVRAAQRGTRLLGPDPIAVTPRPASACETMTQLEVTDESSLSAARRLLQEVDTPVGVLNFFAQRFARVVFAILETRPDAPTRAAFRNVFGR